MQSQGPTESKRRRPANSKPTRVACKACVAAKKACEDQRPCKRCARLNIPCVNRNAPAAGSSTHAAATITKSRTIDIFERSILKPQAGATLQSQVSGAVVTRREVGNGFASFNDPKSYLGCMLPVKLVREFLTEIRHDTGRLSRMETLFNKCLNARLPVEIPSLVQERAHDLQRAVDMGTVMRSAVPSGVARGHVWTANLALCNLFNAHPKNFMDAMSMYDMPLYLHPEDHLAHCANFIDCVQQRSTLCMSDVRALRLTEQGTQSFLATQIQHIEFDCNGAIRSLRFNIVPTIEGQDALDTVATISQSSAPGQATGKPMTHADFLATSVAHWKAEEARIQRRTIQSFPNTEQPFPPAAYTPTDASGTTPSPSAPPLAEPSAHPSKMDEVPVNVSGATTSVDVPSPTNLAAELHGLGGFDDADWRSLERAAEGQGMSFCFWG